VGFQFHVFDIVNAGLHRERVTKSLDIQNAVDDKKVASIGLPVEGWNHGRANRRCVAHRLAAPYHDRRHAGGGNEQLGKVTAVEGQIANLLGFERHREFVR